MTALLEIRDKLQDTTATIEQLQRALATHPTDAALVLTIKSLEQRQNSLAEAFAEAADQAHVDVCDYRLIPEGQSSSIAAVTSALSAFQDLITVVFDAIKNGPKLRARPSADIVRESTLDFGYAYPGSLGFVLTMPNERLLVGESELDSAIGAIFEVAKAENAKQVAAYVPRVGVAGIRKLYAWSRALSDHSLSANIKWERQETARAALLIQTQELARLSEIIDEASEESAEEISIVGELTGLDVGAGDWFRIAVPSAPDLVGKVADSFNRGRNYQIHGRYSATLLKKGRIQYSTQKEDEWWELLELREQSAK